jgi:tetratricopeptide (TPR) repeat protein
MELGDSLIGTVLADRYRIESTLGAGGMGAVFRATRIGDADDGSVERGAVVAVKVLPPGDGRSSLLPRFLREARLASRVRHPHVVRIHDFGRWGPDRDRYYLAMELVDGLSLDRLLDAGFDVGTCASIADQILDALAHVHARGILHRDIKPENVVVTRDEAGLLSVKVLDFGIAAGYEDDEATRLTQEGAAIGTPAYMAPEQAEGRTLEGPVTDLYPVGVILYRLLSGRMPFEGSLTQVLLAKIQDDPPPLTPRPGLSPPAELLDVVARLVARRPEDRFAMAPDVRAALAPFCTRPRIDAAAWRAAGGGGGDDVDTALPDDDPTFPGLDGDDTMLPGQLEAQAETDIGERLYGREAELEQLEALARNVEAGEGRIALVGGGPGLGKSALLDAFGISMAEQGRFQVLRAAYDRGGGRQAGIRAALESFLGTSGEPRAGVERAIREMMRRYGEADDDEVRELLDFIRPTTATDAEVGADRRERRFAVYVRALRRMARSRPVLLLLDDLDAGGADAGAFLAFVAFEIGFESFPLMVVTSYRDRRDPIFNRALASSDRYEGGLRHTLALGPIPEPAMCEWLERSVGLTSGHAQAVARRAGGNPLFAEHLARAGTEALESSRSTLAAVPDTPTATHTGLPVALRSLLEASLEECLARSEHPDRAREVLVHLAVLGTRASAELVERYLEGGAAQNLDDVLDELISLEILNEDGSGEVVGFAQGLMRDVILEGLGRRRARRLHRRAAEVRAERPGAVEEAGEIGDHYEAAGDVASAVTWWRRAVDRKLAAGESMAGAHWGTKALEAMDADDPERARLGIRLGHLLSEMGELDAAQAILLPIVDGADVDAAMLAGEALADLQENRGLGAAFDRLMQKLESRLGEASEEGQRAYHHTKTLALNYLGAYPEALEHASKAVALAREGSTGQQRAMLRKAMVHALMGDPGPAVELGEKVVEEADDSSDLMSRALRTLGFIYSHAAKPDRALATHERALELARRTGRAGRVPVAYHDIAAALAALDRNDEARKAAEQAVRSAEELGIENIAVFAGLKILALDLLAGHAEGTPERFDALIERAHRAGMHMLDNLTAPTSGWAFALLGRHEEARERLASVDSLAGYPKIFEIAQILHGIGRTLARLHGEGHTDYGPLARRYLVHARSVWTTMGDETRANACETLLGELGE